MNLFNQAFANLGQKRATGSLTGMPFFGFGAGATTKAGGKINTNTALKISAFFCGVTTIANSLALLPKHVMTKNKGKINLLNDHPVDYMIHNEPNKLMTAFSFWFSFAVCMLMKGNGYALIVRNGSGVPISMTLWDNEDVTPMFYNGELFYKHSKHKTLFFASEVFHVPAFCFDGISGRSALQYAADNLGVSLAADEFAADAYADKGLNYGVIEVQAGIDITKPGKNALKYTFEKNLATGNKDRVTVLDEGMRYRPISITPAESAFIAAKAQGVEDIARWLSIPLHKLHAKGEGGYNFLVQMSMEYLQTAVQPLGQKIKEEIQRKLLSRDEKVINGAYIFMNYRKLLEVDPAARAQYFKDMVYIKAMNPNEVRAAEDMSPYAGGDEFLQMTNLQTQDEIDKKLKDEKQKVEQTAN